MDKPYSLHQCKYSVYPFPSISQCYRDIYAHNISCVMLYCYLILCHTWLDLDANTCYLTYLKLTLWRPLLPYASHFTDIDYADDVALLVDKEVSFRAALVSMDGEASKFGLRVSWTKTKIQNLGSGPTPSPITWIKHCRPSWRVHIPGQYTVE